MQEFSKRIFFSPDCRLKHKLHGVLESVSKYHAIYCAHLGSTAEVFQKIKLHELSQPFRPSLSSFNWDEQYRKLGKERGVVVEWSLEFLESVCFALFAWLCHGGPKYRKYMGEHGSCFATSAPAPVISFLDVSFVLLRDTKKGQWVSHL